MRLAMDNELLFGLITLKEQSTLEIETPTAIAAIRGTSFGLIVVDTITTLCVEEGTVRLHARAAEGLLTIGSKKQHHRRGTSKTAIIMINIPLRLCYTTTMRKNNGFTLLELLTVIAIIIILAGILIPAIGIVRQKAKAARAQADIESLSVALKMYEADFGAFPEAVNPNQFKKDLGEKLTVGTATYGPYMEFKSKDTSGYTFNDPWGKPYVYTVPGSHNTASFDIYSFGPNKTDNQGGYDDITNW